MLHLRHRNREAYVGFLLCCSQVTRPTTPRANRSFPICQEASSLRYFRLACVAYSSFGEESQLTDCPTSPRRFISCPVARSLAPRLFPPSLPPLETFPLRLSRPSPLSPSAINSSPPRSSPALPKKTTTSMPHSPPARLSRTLYVTRSRLSRSCKTSGVLALVERSGWTYESSPPILRLFSPRLHFVVVLRNSDCFLRRFSRLGCSASAHLDASAVSRRIVPYFTNDLDMHKRGLD
jgi:hypothetical protein